MQERFYRNALYKISVGKFILSLLKNNNYIMQKSQNY